MFWALNILFWFIIDINKAFENINLKVINLLIFELFENVLILLIDTYMTFMNRHL